MAIEAFLFAREVGVAILIFLVTYFSVRFLIVPHFCRQIQKNHSNKKLPPGPKGWPFLGALPLLGTKPHVTLTNMARQYGPVMHLKMGPSHTVVASTSAGAKQFLKTLDHNFSNRPAITGANHLGYNAQDMVFLEYGPKWKLFKKLSTMHMLGSKALEDLGEVRASEVSHMVRGMHESSQKGEAINVGELLTCVITNIISQVILSRRIFESHKDLESKEYKEMVVEFMMISGVSPGDFVPTINWMDLQGLVARMKRLHKRFDAFLTKMVEGHLNSGRHHHRLKGKQDFLDVLLANSEDLSSDPRLNFTDIKALLLDMFTAGTDSSSSIITWAIAEMLKNPNILMKAQKEIDQMVGRERRIVESDLQKLPYLQAICKETYRLHPSTPLSIPRVSTEACEVDGYYIPKNTWLNVNIYAIGRDPDVWDNPLEFHPERFMSGKNANISPSGVDFELIPFGAGRRMCVGYKMAMVMIEYILGTLVHSFDWKLPNGSDLNMEEAFGITLHKAEPLFAMISPRLVPHAYA